ncbi:MAG: sulfurtransferase complex subunit TusD [Proteobacteria bacterium]|nr:MAG: sulfurtransferase complex subunit TusD [Pseudomonadota bacterium]PIE40343.1 MAG: sulfurtransferase complex subunit TusD [Gammaproteobacteria bacterium]
MKYSIVINQSGNQSDSPFTALAFARELINQKHDIYRVFLYRQAVEIANDYQQLSTDETDIQAQWKLFSQEHEIDVVVCIAAALRRGVVDENEARRYDKRGNNCTDHFELSGLGQLVDAVAQSDRVISF